MSTYAYVDTILPACAVNFKTGSPDAYKHSSDLTTDRRTFWVHRDKIRDMGVEILRPSELLDLYIPYWDAMEYEFARRRAESRR